MFKRYPFILTCLATLALSAISAHATLTYWVDTANQQITFNGSAVGGPNNNDYSVWEVYNLPNGSSSLSESIGSISGSVTDSGGTTSNSLWFFGVSTATDSSEERVDLLFEIVFDSRSDETSTLVVDNLVFSYSSFDSRAKSYISSLVTEQTPLLLTDGHGYGSVTYGSPIPEASHFALLLGGAVALLLVRRRIKSRK